jgi:leucyl aminopeptidase
MKNYQKILFILLVLVILSLIGVIVASWMGLIATPFSPQATATPEATSQPTIITYDQPAVEEPNQSPSETAPAVNITYTCAYDPTVEALQAELTAEQWFNWIELLSGQKPVEINGESYTITSRYTESLFNGDPNARAFEFVHDQLALWGYEDQATLFVEEYMPFDYDTETPWKNLIAVLPGTDPELAQQEILLTAHLDSITAAVPEGTAPGADDNATGVATLLEAARVLKDHAFERTIKLVFFSGEERGLHGSRAYAAAHADELENIAGVINLDMFGYDADDDRCFELHVGILPASDQLGTCLTDTLETYDLALNYDYLTQNAITASDHSSFWRVDVGAVLVLENFITQDARLGCGEMDRNPNYHTESDLPSEINLNTAFDIAQAAILTTATIADPSGN